MDRHSPPLGQQTQALALPTTNAAGWLLVRDAVVFQGKLVLAGFLGIVLGPVAVLAAIAALVVHAGHPGRYFYPVVRLGRQLESWINLYGDADGDTRRTRHGTGLDAAVAHLERAIAEITARGAVTPQTRQDIDAAFDDAKQART